MLYREKVKENNPIAFQVIKNQINTKKVSHSYLFSAPKNVSIEDEPKFLIQSLISREPFISTDLRSIESYPDLIVVDGSEESIKKDDIINAIIRLNQTPLDAEGKKILLVKNIELANNQSLNSLLKFIEEPTKNTYIIMTTNNLSQVLSTIRSRSQVINLRAVPVEKVVAELKNVGIDLKLAKVIASMSSSVAQAKEFYSSDFIKHYEYVVQVLTSAITKPDKIYSELFNYINKNNYHIVVNLLRVFYSDVWKIVDGLPLSFVDEEAILNKYSISKFKFDVALSEINDFIVMQGHNANFDLSKSQLLIKLVRSYE